MLSTLDFESKVISFSEINLIPFKGSTLSEVPYCCPPFHPEGRTGILTRDSALLLLQLHPLVLWTSKHFCVLGRRILHLVSPHVYGKDLIRVGYLPKATEAEVKSIMAAEPLLNQIAFATQSGSKGIFTTSRKMNKEILNAVSPLLDQPIDTIAKLFSDCSPSTLFKLNSKLDDSK